MRSAGAVAARGGCHIECGAEKKRLDAKTLVTTPNSDVIYAMSYVDLGTDGPLVFEAPPNLQGILLDFWQRPIPVDGGKFAGDVGLPGEALGAINYTIWGAQGNELGNGRVNVNALGGFTGAVLLGLFAAGPRREIE